MKTISEENYSVDFDEANNDISLNGTLRLRGLEEYSEISLFLEQCAQSDKACNVNVTALEFLNSSGIAMLSKFIINARKNGKQNVSMVGSKDIPWQSKSLHNLVRLMPDLKLTFE